MSDADAQKYRRLAERCLEEAGKATLETKFSWFQEAAKYAKLAVQADKRVNAAADKFQTETLSKVPRA